MIVKLVWGPTLKFNGSETARAPLGTVNELLPLKVTVWRVLVWMLFPPGALLVASATVMAVMGRSVVPKAFETRMRI